MPMTNCERGVHDWQSAALPGWKKCSRCPLMAREVKDSFDRVVETGGISTLPDPPILQAKPH